MQLGARKALWNGALAWVPGNAFRVFMFRWLFRAKIGHDTRIWRGLRIDGMCHGNIQIGSNCEIPRGAFFNCSEGLRIGNRVFFGHDVSFFGADHDPDHPDMPARYAPICVQDGAWIASRATILKGVTVGCGAVVAYGAVVTKNVPPWAIVAGVPARFLRYRKCRPLSDDEK